MSLEHYDIEQAVCSIAHVAWDAPRTTEESLREFLAACFGPSWRDCALQANQLNERVIYTASKPVRIYTGMCQMVYVVDRDERGQWYVAPPSPVSGDAE